MKRIRYFNYVLALVFGLMAFTTSAQTTVTLGTGTSSSNTYGPIYRSSAGSSYDYSRYHHVYTAAELSAAGISPGATITSIGWDRTTAGVMTGGDATLKVYIKNSSATVAVGNTWTNLIAGATQVRDDIYNTTNNLPSGLGYWTLNFSTPVVYTGGALEVSVDWDCSVVAGSPTTDAFRWKYGNVGFNASTYANNSSLPTTITTVSANRPNTEFTYTAAACPGPTGLAGANFMATTADLSWTAATGASMYDWKVVAAGAGSGGVAVASGSIAGTSVTATGLTQVTNYDLYVRSDCGGSGTSVYGGPYNFTTGCPSALSGTYTIGAAGDYTTFAAALLDLSQCGVSGPVTFNVAAGTYTGEISITEITGTSAVNTVTFNGASAATTTITYDGANTQNSTIELDGADYITFSNLTIENTESSSNGWGVHLTNTADNNTIDNCIINVNTTSTGSTFVGVLASGSKTSISSTGNNANNTTVSNNTINGSYYGVRFYGMSSATPNNSNNTVSGCTFVDAYYYGIYFYYQDSPIADGNTVPSLRSTGAGYGVYSNYGKHPIVRNNELHGARSYGIYLSQSNTTTQGATLRGSITNNMVSTLSAGEGIYLVTSDNIDVFYNTVKSETTEALWINSTSDNYDVRNNIFVADFVPVDLDAVPSGGSVIDYNIYYNTTGGNIATATTAYTDLADWQTGDATQNVNSLEGDPTFLGATDLHLGGTIANAAATPIVGITTDIDGDTRDVTTPDIGADEYMPPSCSQPSALTASGFLAASANLAWTAGGSETTWDIEHGATGFTPTGTPTVTGTMTNPHTLTGLTANTSYDYYVRADCGGSGTSTWAGPYTFTTTPLAVTVPYTQDFEAGSLADFGLSTGGDAGLALDVGSNCTATNALLFTGGSSSGWSGSSTSSSATQAWVTNTTKHSQADLSVDATGVTNSLILTFNLKQIYVYGADYTWFRVLVNGTQIGPDYQPSTATGDPCAPITVDLSAYKGTTFTLSFQGSNKYDLASGSPGNSSFLDDISITEVSCVNPTALGTASIGATTASLSWTAGGTETQWDIEHGATGFTPTGTATVTGTTTNPHSLTGLTAETSYDFYVRADCGSGVSGWSGPYTFTTLCAATSTFPYIENFDAGTTTPTCWVQDPANVENWTFGSNAIGHGATSDHTSGTGNYARIDDSQTQIANPASMTVAPVDLSGLTTPRLVFWYQNRNTSTASGTSQLHIDVYNGSTWTNSVLSITTNLFAWTEYTVDLTPYKSTYTLVRFRAIEDPTGFNSDPSLDDVKIEETPSCLDPSALMVTNITTTGADLGWTENGTATTWDIEWGATGFTQGAGTMVTGTTTNPHALSSLTANTAYDFYVRADCGGSGTSAWAGPYTFTTLCAAMTTFPYNEGFENGGAMPSCWSQEYASSTVDWTFTGANQNSSVTARTGSYLARFYSGNYNTDATKLISPPMDLTGLTTPRVKFYHTQVDWGGDQDELRVYYKTSAGGAWTLLATYTSAVLAWTEVILTLPSASADYYIAFEGIGGYGRGVTIDDVTVEETPSCLDPSALMVTNITTTGADLGWTENGTATTWDIEWGATGFTQGAGTMVTGTTTNPHALSSLTANTAYDFYVRADCGGTGTSGWVGPYTFTTACNVFSAFPFNEDFTSGGANLSCWTTSITTGVRDWEFGTDNGSSINGNDMALFDDDAAGSNQDNNAALTSPVFDLSALTNARMTFDYHLRTISAGESLTTEVWDGTAWQNVLTYTTNDNAWTGTGGQVAIIDISTYINAAFQVRFTFDDGAGANYGWYAGVDNFLIEEITPNDIAITAVSITSGAACNASDSVTIDIANVGTVTQTTFPVSYTINGGTAVTETWTGSLVSGATVQHTFATTFDASIAGNYMVEAYTALVGDQNLPNDTLATTTTTAPTYGTPSGEDFENFTNLNWASNGTISNAHSAPSNVLFFNLWSSSPGPFTTITPKVGTISTGDILKFDYRYVDYAGGAGNVATTLGTNDKLYVFVSADCGANYTILDSIYDGNHVSSTSMAAKVFDLSAYAGQTIQVATQAVYGSGDYFVDLDNFFIGAPIMTSTSVASNFNGADVSCNGAADGEGDVNATGGLTPYTYMWDAATGSQTDDTATALVAGKYYVTVMDAIGNMAVDSVTITEPMVVTSSTTQVNVACNAGSTGTGTVTGAGGTGMYTYAWDAAAANQTTATATGLAAGKYLVTLTDANGCMTMDSVMITEPAMALSSSITASTNVLCTGANTGSATVTATGGTGAYTYLWDNSTGLIDTPGATGGSTTATATGLAAGTYNVTVTDANGCTSTSMVTITEPVMALSSSITAQTNILCNGNSTGAATVTAAGGTGAYSYLWNDGMAQTTATATGLAAGMYSVVVTDANMCTSTSMVTITEPTVLTSSITASANVDCNGNNTGSATVTGAGGTGAYSFLWNDGMGQTTATATGLAAGMYSVVVTDANMCTSTSMVTITEPTVLVSSITASTNVDCNGNSTGSATVTATGGTTAYSYMWSNSVTTSSITGVAAGTYTVTITDANMCTSTSSVTITEPTMLMTTVVETQQASCSGGNDGIATVTPTGGTMPYTYTWDANAASQTTAIATNLAAGTYTVTVTDGNMCTSMKSVTITSPFGLAATTSIFSNVSCNGGSDGAVNITVTGGTAPFIFTWNNGETTEDIFNVPAGTYSVVVSDANGCSLTATATVTEPMALSASTMTTNALCNGGSDGTVDLTVAGGTAPYTYAWDNGALTEDLSGLVAGMYNVVVTDANGCSTMAMATVTEPTVLTASATATDASCNGTVDGTATVTASGGTMTYTYAWDDAMTQTTAMATGLAAGTYNVTVTDANGCAMTASATVNEPTAISITGTASDASCNGTMTGSVNIMVTGGSGTYTYAWDNMATTEDLSGVAAGTYSVVVTDSDNCTATSMTYTVGEPAAMTSSAMATDVSCFGNATGTATVTASGGTMAYTYLWDDANAQTTAMATGLAAGTYNVTVTDANGCTTTASATVNQPMAAIAITETHTDVVCVGGNTGSIDLTVTGGTGAYSYIWNNGVNTEDLTNVSVGTYTVTVTDANGCSETISVTLTQPNGFTFSSSIVDATCNGTNGAINMAVSGATAPYSFMWSNGDTTENLTNVMAGTYILVATDANGCTGSSTHVVNGTPGIVVTGMVTDVSCNGGNDGSIMATATGGNGGPYLMTWSGAGTSSGLTAGTYTVTVSDASGCSITETFTVNEPTLLVAIANVGQAIACPGDMGGLTATIGGGTAPYTTVWTDAAGGVVTPSSVPAGMYTATVTDANGCMTTAMVSLMDANPMTAVVSATEVLCNGDANGAIDLIVTGGTPGYSFVWSDPAFGNTNMVSNVSAGAYTVTITDANGCTTTASAVVNEPAQLIVTTTTIADTNSLMIGEAMATVSGGTQPYTSIVWDNGMTGASISGLSEGTYVVTVTDINGCTATASVDVEDVFTSIIPVDFVTNLKVFPNPTVGNITIDLELSDAKDVNVAIYDMAGQLIKDFGHEYTAKTQIRTDLSIFPSGVYLVRFVVEDQVITKRLILSKY